MLLLLLASCADEPAPAAVPEPTGAAQWLALTRPASTGGPAGADPWSSLDRPLDLARFAVRRGQVAREPDALALELAGRVILLASEVDLRGTSRLALTPESERDTELRINTAIGILRRPAESVKLEAGRAREVQLIVNELVQRPGLDVQLGIVAEPETTVRVRAAGLRAAIPDAWRDNATGDGSAHRLQAGDERRRGWVLTPGAPLGARLTPSAGARSSCASRSTPPRRGPPRSPSRPASCRAPTRARCS